MYNEDRKLRYINKKESEVTLSPGYLQNLFNKSAPFEESLGKDLCEWTSAEIVEYYKYLDLYSLSSVTVINSAFSLYVNWCLSETLVPDGQNHYLELDNDTLLECINSSLLEKTIITREELEKCADTLLNDVDRFVFYALFEGICGKEFEEIVNAKLSDIHKGSENLAGGVMHLCTGRILAVSPKLIEVAQMAASANKYYPYKGSRSVNGYQLREEDADLIFKAAKNKNSNDSNAAKNKAQVLSRRYVNSLDHMGLARQMTPKRLMMSGKIDYIKGIMAREGLTVEETVRKYKDDINERYHVEKFNTSYLTFLKTYGRFF